MRAVPRIQTTRKIVERDAGVQWAGSEAAWVQFILDSSKRMPEPLQTVSLRYHLEGDFMQRDPLTGKPQRGDGSFHHHLRAVRWTLSTLLKERTVHAG